MGKAGRDRGGKQRANVTTNSVRKVCNAWEAGREQGGSREDEEEEEHTIYNNKQEELANFASHASRGGQGRAEAGYKICSS